MFNHLFFSLCFSFSLTLSTFEIFSQPFLSIAFFCNGINNPHNWQAQLLCYFSIRSTRRFVLYYKSFFLTGLNSSLTPLPHSSFFLSLLSLPFSLSPFTSLFFLSPFSHFLPLFSWQVPGEELTGSVTITGVMMHHNWRVKIWTFWRIQLIHWQMCCPRIHPRQAFLIHRSLYHLALYHPDQNLIQMNDPSSHLWSFHPHLSLTFLPWCLEEGELEEVSHRVYQLRQECLSPSPETGGSCSPIFSTKTLDNCFLIFSLKVRNLV